MTFPFSVDEQFFYDRAPERNFNGSLPPYVGAQLGTTTAALGKIDVFGDEDIYDMGQIYVGSAITIAIDGLVWDNSGFGAHALSGANLLIVDRLGNIVASGVFFDGNAPQQLGVIAPFSGNYYAVVDGTYADGQYGLALSVSGGIGNTTPAAVDDQYETAQNRAMAVAAEDGLLANDYDADGDFVAVIAVTYLGAGAVDFSVDGSFTYTPAQGFSGLDAFAYTIQDEFGAVDTAVVSILVGGSSLISGTTGPDSRFGTSGDDDAALLAGDDTFHASAGEDVIDGGEGLDTVSYPEARAGFSVQVETKQEVHIGKPVPGSDTLLNVERAEFTDGALLFDLTGDNVEFVYRVYAAAYGRTPDEGGLRFWTGVMDGRGPGAPDAADREFLASFFLTADEFIDLYGSNPSDYQYIDAMYANVLDRVPDQGGYDFWVGAMQGGLGRDDILISFAESAENVAQTAPDLNNGIWVL